MCSSFSEELRIMYITISIIESSPLEKMSVASVCSIFLEDRVSIIIKYLVCVLYTEIKFY
jgi:hypothetical protein